MSPKVTKKAESFLKKLRRERGLTQVELAKKSGVGQNMISMIEGGERELSSETALKLADSLDVEPVAFYLGDRISKLYVRIRAGEATKQDALNLAGRLYPILESEELTEDQEELLSEALVALLKVAGEESG